MSTNTTKYICIESFHDAFTKGKTYDGYPDQLIETGITFIDDIGDKHTITARIFSNHFTEVKYHG